MLKLRVLIIKSVKLSHICPLRIWQITSVYIYIRRKKYSITSEKVKEVAKTSACQMKYEDDNFYQTAIRIYCLRSPMQKVQTPDSGMIKAVERKRKILESDI